MFGSRWERKRKKDYANLTREQRDFMERGMIYQYEELDKQTETMLNRSGMTKEQRAADQKRRAARDTAAQTIMMIEQWRSELFGVPARSLAEIRWHWVQQDPAWLASETSLTEDQRWMRDFNRGR